LLEGLDSGMAGSGRKPGRAIPPPDIIDYDLQVGIGPKAFGNCALFSSLRPQNALNVREPFDSLAIRQLTDGPEMKSSSEWPLDNPRPPVHHKSKPLGDVVPRPLV
jgi:hypothetical protein